MPSALASRLHCKFSPGLWLLYPRFSTVWVFAFVGIWTIGSFKFHRGRPSSALSRLSSPCLNLGIVVNPKKPNYVPARRVQYLGTMIDNVSLRASSSQQRVEKLLSIRDEFLSSRLQSASSWQVLLGILSSLSHLVLGGRLRMWSLQLTLHRCWDRVDDSTLVPWDDRCLHDLSWWLNLDRLQEGVSLAQVSTDLDFWSDASDVGWGAYLGREVVSGWWSPEDASLSVSARGILVVERGLLHFLPLVVGSAVSIFADNSTAVAYLRNWGQVGLVLQLSTPQRRGSSVGRSLIASFWPHSSSWVGTMSSPMPCPGPTRSGALSGC